MCWVDARINAPDTERAVLVASKVSGQYIYQIARFVYRDWYIDGTHEYIVEDVLFWCDIESPAYMEDVYYGLHGDDKW